jgi:acyl-CoA dehydrogenase
VTIGISLLWFVGFLAGAVALAYHRIPLGRATLFAGVALLAYSFFGHGPTAWLAMLWLAFASLVLLNIPAFRLRYITLPFLKTYRRLLPSMSDT